MSEIADIVISLQGVAPDGKPINLALALSSFTATVKMISWESENVHEYVPAFFLTGGFNKALDGLETAVLVCDHVQRIATPRSDETGLLKEVSVLFNEDIEE